MREFVRELIIYQLVAVGLTLLAHPDSDFFPNLRGYLIITNCIAWSIRTVFSILSIRLDFLRWRRHWQFIFGLPAVALGCFVGILFASLVFQLLLGQNILGTALFLSIFKGSLPGAIIVTILILGYYSFRERLESEAVEKERLQRLQARAELAALQSKLNPHFLFNTLNTMVNLVHKEPDKVEEMILGLSDIYRKVLKLPSTERITLAEEFDLARQYLAIEQVRLGDRLRYRIDLPDGLGDLAVPPLLVQPLVENAVLHGIMPAPRGGSLSLSAVDEGGVIRIIVEDDGVGVAGGSADRAAERPGGTGRPKPGIGFGLHGTRERLRLTYGGRGAMKIESPPGGGTIVRLELPVEH